MDNLFSVKIKKINELNNWDSFVQMGLGGTVFHESWYLKYKGVERALCVYKNNELLAILPLYEKDNRTIEQSTKYVPYSGIVFKYNQLSRTTMLQCRKITNHLIQFIKKSYSSVSFSVLYDFQDITPFLNSGFMPEIRYTYIYDLRNGVDNTLFSKGRLLDLKLFSKTGCIIAEDPHLEHFDVSKALFWSDDIDVNEVKKMLLNAISLKRGMAFVAVDSKKSKVQGGLFLVWDKKRAYSIYSYFERENNSKGIPTRLYLEAMYYIKEKCGLDKFDFEGSVLPGVEAFYQSFGAKQTIFFNLFWKENKIDLLHREWYVYE